MIDKSEIVECKIVGEGVQSCIRVDAACYGLIPIENPIITRVLEWARELNVPINEFDRLSNILQAQKVVTIDH